MLAGAPPSLHCFIIGSIPQKSRAVPINSITLNQLYQKYNQSMYVLARLILFTTVIITEISAAVGVKEQQNSKYNSQSVLVSHDALLCLSESMDSCLRILECSGKKKKNFLFQLPDSYRLSKPVHGNKEGRK